MKKLALAVLAAAVLAAVLFQLLHDPEEPSGGAQIAGPGAPAAGPTSPRGTTEPPAVLAPPPAGEGVTTARVAAAADDAARDFDPAPGRDLRVRVELPPGHPAGEAVEVWGFFGSPSLWNLGEGVRDGLDASEIAGLGGASAWAREPVRGGEVRLPLPADAVGVALVAVGRYLQPEPLALTLDPATLAAEHRLAPALGAALDVVVVPPSGVDPADLAGLAVDLLSSGRGRARLEASAVQALASLGYASAPSGPPDLERSFRGVAPEAGLRLRVSAPGLLDPEPAALELTLGRLTKLEVPLERGAELVVRVRGEDGEPLEHANLNLWSTAVRRGQGSWSSGRAYAGTNAEGSARLAGLAPGEYVLEVDHDSHVQQRLNVHLGLERREELDVTLARGQVLRGTVHWPDGRPAEHVAVDLDHRETYTEGASVTTSQSSRQTRTDHEGAFEFAGLGGGVEALRVTASGAVDAGERAEVLGVTPGRVFRAIAEHPPLDAPLALELAPALELAGLAVDAEGEPLRVAFSVRAWPAGGQEWDPRTEHAWVAAADAPALGTEDGHASGATEPGRFTLHPDAPGAWLVAVEAEGFRRQPPVRVEVPQVEPLVVSLAGALQVSARVVDPGGAPVGGARVLVREQGRPFQITSVSADEAPLSDADGRVALALEEVPAEVYALHPDWAPSATVRVGVDGAAVPEPVTLVLRAGATIRGVVRDADGAPWPGREVRALTGPVSPILALERMGPTAPPALTDADGRFELRHVEPGDVTVVAAPNEAEVERRVAEHDGDDEVVYFEIMGEVLSERLTVADGEVVEVELGAEPKRPVRVHGRVSRGGEPTAAQIMVLAEQGPPLAGAKGARADEDGRYELTLDRPGTYVFLVRSDGSQGEGESIVVPVPAADEHARDLALADSVVRGVVLGPDGDGAAGVPVQLTPEEDTSSPLAMMRGGTRTASDGTFELVEVPPGRYTVRTNAARGGLDSGQAAYGIGLVEGVEVRAGRDVDGLVVRLAGGASLVGTVRDAEGAPVAGAAVFVRDGSGRVLVPVSGTSTRADGSWRVDGLPPGEATAFARKAGSITREARPLTLRAGEEGQLELTLASGAYLVLAPELDDQPVRVRASVVDEAGRAWHGIWSEEDLLRWTTEGSSSTEPRLGPLPAGRYTVTATALDGAGEARKTVTVREGQEERRVVLRLR